MNKELFVSTTPHETKVGITEDDQLAEIYLERENEYTLAGSIYKGRVTRVLPGMQSAFVDIGLERDAFLYVSDFMDLEQQDEDLDEAIPANRPVSEARPRNGGELGAPALEGQFTSNDGQSAAAGSSLSSPLDAPGNSSGGGRDFRGRRRRRGRRGENDRGAGSDRGGVRGTPNAELGSASGVESAADGAEASGNFNETPRTETTRTESTQSERPRNDARSDSRGNYRNDRSSSDRSGNDRFNRGDRGRPGGRFSRPSPAPPVESGAGRGAGGDYDYGPPPGYQPIILPGESISKYQRQQSTEPSLTEHSSPEAAAAHGEGQELESSVPALSASPSAMPSFGNTSFGEDEPSFAARTEELLPGHHEHELASDGEATSGAQIEPSSALRTAAETYPLSSPEPLREPQRQPRRGRSRGAVREIATEMGNESGLATAPALAPTLAPTPDPTTEPEATASAHHALEEQVVDEPAAEEQVIEARAMEEQEIDGEEVDLAYFGEEHTEMHGEGSGDEDDFEETEQETRALGEGAAHAGAAAETAELGAAGEPSASGEAVPEAVLEAEEREAEEMELEEAQAEAEALLEAEAIGEGTIDASAEVRGPAPEAMLVQRAQRPQRGPERGFDRQRGRRGGGGGGRNFRSRENTVVPQISELLKEGQEILIQIAKEPIAKKGARITSHIALPGRFLVFMPTVNHTGVSRKIASEEERQRLKRIIQSERENGAGGFIVRTAAAGATDDELRADIRFLKNLWNEIKTRSDDSKSPALIYHDLNVVERVLRDQVTSDFSVIWVDTEQEYERILRFANRFQPSLVRRVKLYTKETPLYDQFGLNEEINKALKSKVWLKSGGYIVINQTEALVAIDVNTGKYVGKTTRLEDTIVKTNVDAIKEIVRQVRLRDLGGIIIIDFIDMDERRNRQKVMQALEEALRLDRAPSKVLQFNDFGLVAITRKRVKQSLERTIGTPCPYCQSTGFVKSVGTICNEVYVEMRKISNHLENSDVLLRVNPEVAKQLKTNNAKLLNEMEELTKKTIIVKSDPALHQEQFDIH